MTAARPGRIEVRIDELVLDGLTPAQAAVVADAVRAQLAVALQGWAPPGRTVVDRLDGGSFVMAGGMTPGTVGEAVTRQVRQALPSAPGTPGTQALAPPPQGAR
jgi:hypothetical protein